MANTAQYRIPVESITTVLAMHFATTPMRQIYLAVYPSDPPVSFGTFQRAVWMLIAETQELRNKLAREAQVPTDKQFDEAMSDDDKLVALTLCPTIQEYPLSAEDQTAADQIDWTRGTLLNDLTILAKMNPKIDGPVDEETRKAKLEISRQMTANVQAIIAAANQRLTFSRWKLQRTVVLHNLRIAGKQEGENALRDIRDALNESDKSNGVQTHDSNAAAPARFLLDMNGTGETH